MLTQTFILTNRNKKIQTNWQNKCILKYVPSERSLS